MKRRNFITLMGAAAAWPIAGRAQQLPVIGLLSGTNREDRLIGAIWKGLNETGFVEGRNAVMEFRFAEGQFERLPALAAELIERRASVIVAMQSVTAPLAAKAASTRCSAAKTASCSVLGTRYSVLAASCASINCSPCHLENCISCLWAG